jgi:hypothetical protein
LFYKYKEDKICIDKKAFLWFEDPEKKGKVEENKHAAHDLMCFRNSASYGGVSSHFLLSFFTVLLRVV